MTPEVKPYQSEVGRLLPGTLIFLQTSRTGGITTHRAGHGNHTHTSIGQAWPAAYTQQSVREVGWEPK